MATVCVYGYENNPVDNVFLTSSMLGARHMTDSQNKKSCVTESETMSLNEKFGHKLRTIWPSGKFKCAHLCISVVLLVLC